MADFIGLIIDAIMEVRLIRWIIAAMIIAIVAWVGALSTTAGQITVAVAIGFLVFTEFSSGWGGEAAYNGRQ